MAHNNKWDERSKPEDPITIVAQRALRRRLKTVRQYAKLAANQPEKDIEYVHQLRVATRRTRAAMQIFSDLLPAHETCWMEKTLRRLRRAAGKARDLDVFRKRLERLAKTRKTKEAKSLTQVIAQIDGERDAAQKPLNKSYKKARRDGFKERSRKLVEGVHWRSDEPEPNLGAAAKIRLAPLVEKFAKASATDLSDIAALHKMRICGKEVRYGLELLTGAFDTSIYADLYPVFEEVQEKLGEVNDHATAITMLNEWFERTKHKRAQTQLAKLIADEEKQFNGKREIFCAWWTPQRAQELMQRFRDLLGETAMNAATDPPASANGRPNRRVPRRKITEKKGVRKLGAAKKKSA